MSISKPNIVLIGFMGTGKSTVGQVLAQRLDKKFIETDALVEQKANQSIQAIFTESEIRFRELEMQVCKEIASQTNLVIATGGGVVLNKLNIDYLRKTSIIVLLQAPAKTIYERVINDSKNVRPLLDKPEPYTEIKSLLEFRRPYYINAADITINTYQKSIDQIIGEILDKLDSARKSITLPKSKNNLDFRVGINGEFTGFKDKDQCLICLSELKEVKPPDIRVCSICNQPRLASHICCEGHFICDRCYVQDFFEFVQEYIKTTTLKDPLKIAQDLMLFPKLAMSPQEISMIVVAALLIGLYNTKSALNKMNSYGSVSISRIIVALQRASILPGNLTAFYGIDNAAVGVGIACAVFLDATPKRPKDIELAQKSMPLLIEKLHFGSLSAKDAIFTAIKYGMDYFQNTFNVKW